jgi:DNA-directed RNA polymerase subunit E'/Rpb7
MTDIMGDSSYTVALRKSCGTRSICIHPSSVLPWSNSVRIESSQTIKRASELILFSSQSVEAKLKDDVEGTCSGRFVSNQQISHLAAADRVAHFYQGYIIRVISIAHIGEGTIKPGSGLAEFRSRYTAIVMKPVSKD